MNKSWTKLAATGVLMGAFYGTGCANIGEETHLPDRGNEASEASSGSPETGLPADVNFDSGDFGDCNELDVNFEKRIPTVMLVVDRSSSMFDNAYGSSPDRWAPLYKTLVDAGSGIVSELDADIRFGFMTYTNQAHAQTCPAVTEVAPAMDNFGAIKAAYDHASSKPSFKGETPTGPAIHRARQILNAIETEGPKYIVLATDGEPDTCGHPDPQCGQDESITAVQEAYTDGIETIVIGLGNDVGAKHLRDLANAGTGQPVEGPDQSWLYTCHKTGISGMNANYAASGGDAVFYKPTDTAQLTTDMNGIIMGVRDCAFDLKLRVEPEDAHLCDVELDGTPLEYGVSWELASDTRLELVGESCEALKKDSKKLYINCPCDVLAPL